MTILKFEELKAGMVVVPYRGVTWQKKIEELDWSWSLQSAWWQHIVTNVSENEVTFARPHAKISPYSRQPWLACEVYSMNKGTDRLFLLLVDNN